MILLPPWVGETQKNHGLQAWLAGEESRRAVVGKEGWGEKMPAFTSRSHPATSHGHGAKAWGAVAASAVMRLLAKQGKS